MIALTGISSGRKGILTVNCELILLELGPFFRYNYHFNRWGKKKTEGL